MNNTTTSEQTTEKNAIFNKASQENIEKYLKGISFPAEKAHILEQAKKNSAPQTILDDLSKLKEQKYNNQSEITKMICH